MDDEILGGKAVSERTGVPTAADRRLLAERLRYLVAGEDGQDARRDSDAAGPSQVRREAL